MATTTPKSTTERSASNATKESTSSRRSTRSTLVAALKKPFQGWSKEALWAREGLDDDYNFPTGGRRGC
ncbi:hypothetical protein K458DRAFT_418684 [Lentithecium fluviatile CBS 122367]|uniref:Uncharacterized protein n=1 Tax=Lentithecium fluviatile CBS 122367 TaxID=1168545 RepID=A0A6G1IZK9_9PLEO|nr:hypothetical protein K458DRAFT_418684 [Lentithecium fluviatile CBS 122367]